MRDDDIHSNISAAHEDDIEKARKLVRKAIAEASEDWISIPAISDALMLEFVELASRCTSRAQLANHFSNIANRLIQHQKQIH